MLDRLRELKYTSPQGKVFTPLWDELSRDGGKKTSILEIPESDFHIVQDLGGSAKKYPLQVYFSGKDYDLIADKFFSALGEKGRAKLSHPRWGDLDVLPLTYSQSESFVDNVQVAKFQIDFIDAKEITALTSAENTAASLAQNAEAASETLATSTELVSENQNAFLKFKTSAKKRIREINNTLSKIQGVSDDIKKEIEEGTRFIESGIDLLAENPVKLMQSFISVVRAPARAGIRIFSKVDGYVNTIKESIEAIKEIEKTSLFFELYSMIALCFALAESATEGELKNRTEAISAHDKLVKIIAEVENAIEYGKTKGFSSDPKILELLAQLKAQAAKYLLESSFYLPSERIITLDADSTPLQLAHRFFNDADRFKELIDINNWTGELIFILPQGTEVKYYG